MFVEASPMRGKGDLASQETCAAIDGSSHQLADHAVHHPRCGVRYPR
jgi:hypothetical protein